ncbi:HDIG domain-containing protein [Iocasia frigidifontis]|uniref:HDIG domain-containing protein n=1 Tax=Iocasia fonsfrigidae TaxID=2682810 RepID=A0A8A7KES8_9FIRM|nr:HDIG domain-containing metalloprotein [Iocasia fonsfrigidae]QTL97969.1 HDIG domain-containing protein [Iocasia fonsfrigidae]
MLNHSIINKWWKKLSKKSASISPHSKKMFWGISFIIVIILILTIDLFPSNVNLETGQVSKRDIEAPMTITYVDEEKTAELKSIAAESAGRVYEEDRNIENRIEKDINGLFKQIKELRDEETAVDEEMTAVDGKNREELIKDIEANYPVITLETIEILLETPPDLFNELEQRSVNTIKLKLKERIHPEDLPEIREELVQEVMAMDLNKEYRLVLANIVETMIRPNMIFDEEATKKKQEEAVKKVVPYKHTIKQGEMIIRKGDIVTSEDIKELEALGLQRPQINYLSIFGIVTIILTLIVMACLYFYKYQPDVWEAQPKIILLQLLVIIVLIIAKIIDIIPAVNYFHLPYLVPVAIASILTTVLISTDVAVVLTVFISFLVAIIFNNDYNIALTGFIGGLVGIFSVSKLSQRNDLVRAGFNVSAVMVVLIMGLTFNSPFRGWLDLLGYISAGVINGVLVAILANGLLPYLENAFGLTSSVKLLELSNPSHPLIKRLLVEAPGTYHHCVIVGNLAETAADNIGADSLLARVGAYYHDIGKMKRPYFFIENYYAADNPHDKLSANLSALIIKSHVKDGVELAREFKLPESIIDIIRQHHGTNLIAYFYQQAIEETSEHDNVEESDFRYDGPKPQTRESAVIMLADIVEAAIRSKNFNKNNHNRIEGFVRELIRNKLIEGQLDESDLSLKELDIITESFVKVLTGIYHQRVEYPDSLLKEMKRVDKSDKDRDK